MGSLITFRVHVQTQELDDTAPSAQVAATERDTSDMTDTVSDLPPRFAALAGAHRHALPSSCSRDTALPLPEPAIQPMMLVRYRPGTTDQTTHAVHLAPLPN